MEKYNGKKISDVIPEKMNDDNRSNNNDWSFDDPSIKHILQKGKHPMSTRSRLASLLKVAIDTEESQKKAINEAFDIELEKKGLLAKFKQVGIDASAANIDYGQLFHNALMSKHGQWPMDLYDDLMSEAMIDATGRIRQNEITDPGGFFPIRAAILAGTDTRAKEDAWKRWIIGMALNTLAREMQEWWRKSKKFKTIAPREEEESTEEFFGERAFGKRKSHKWEEIARDFRNWLVSKDDSPKKRVSKAFDLWMEERTQSEIAKILGVSSATVSVDVMPQIREKLTEYAEASDDPELLKMVSGYQAAKATLSYKKAVAKVAIRRLGMDPTAT